MMAAMGKLKVEISIHFLYTEEDLVYFLRPPIIVISIHFLYTEEDRLDSLPPVTLSRFQSTSSIQRKTGKVKQLVVN